MPNIREYTNTLNALNPSETGIQAQARVAQHASQIGQQEEGDLNRVGSLKDREGAELGRAVQGAAGAAGEVYKQSVEQPDIAKASVQGTKLLASLGEAKDAYLSHPDNMDDPEAGKKFIEDKMEPALQDYVGSADTAAGREHAQQLAQHIRQHMSTEIGADMKIRAKDQAISKLQEIGSTASDMIARNPAMYEVASDMYQDSVQELLKAGGIDANTASKITTEGMDHWGKQFAHAAIVGLVQGDGERKGNPEEALRQIQSGRFKGDIDGVEELKFIKQAQAMEKMQRSADRVEQTRQQQLAVTGRMSDAFQKFVTVGDDGNAVIKPGFAQEINAIAGMPGVHWSQPLEMARFMRTEIARNEKGMITKTDSATMDMLTDRVLKGDMPTHEEILGLYNQGMLSPKGMRDYQSLIAKDPEATADFKTVNGYISRFRPDILKPNMMTPNGSAETAVQWGRFKDDMQQQFSDMRKQGKSRDEALGAIKDQIEKGNGLAPYKMSMDETLRAMSNKATGQTTKPPVPDAVKWDGKETPEEWMKRVGVK